MHNQTGRQHKGFWWIGLGIRQHEIPYCKVVDEDAVGPVINRFFAFIEVESEVEV